MYSKGLPIFILVLLYPGVLILLRGHLLSFHIPCHVPRVEKTLRKRLFFFGFVFLIYSLKFGSSLLPDLLFISPLTILGLPSKVTGQLDNVCT